MNQYNQKVTATLNWLEDHIQQLEDNEVTYKFAIEQKDKEIQQLRKELFNQPIHMNMITSVGQCQYCQSYCGNVINNVHWPICSSNEGDFGAE